MNFPASATLSSESKQMLEQTDPQAFQVFSMSNGNRSVAAIAAELYLNEAEVWAALDRLADMGALQQRVTPPSATPHPALLNRRDAMGRLMMGALGAGVLMSAPQAFAATDVKAAAAGQEIAKGRQEQAKKQQEQQALKAGKAEEDAKRKARERHSEEKSKDIR